MLVEHAIEIGNGKNMKENMGMEVTVERMAPYKTNEEIEAQMFKLRAIQQNLAKKLGPNDPDVLEIDTMVRSISASWRNARGLDNPNPNQN